jgi:hypothetical protein
VSDAPDGPGDVPPPPPDRPASELNRTALIVAAVVLAAAAVAVSVAQLAGDDGEGAEPPPGSGAPTVVSEPDDGTTTTTEAPDATTTTTTGPVETVVGLRVVDSGFSTYPGIDGPTGSYGLILENSGDKPLTRFTVQVVVHDTNDDVVASYDHEVAVMRPGARLGLGDEISDPLPNGIGRLDIRTEERRGDPVPQGAFTVADVSTTSDEFGVYTTFVVSSSYEVGFRLSHAYAVYRDAAGKIMGGAAGLIDVIPAGGRATGEVTAFTVVPNVARADVYVDPGLS